MSFNPPSSHSAMIEVISRSHLRDGPIMHSAHWPSPLLQAWHSVYVLTRTVAGLFAPSGAICGLVQP